MAHPRLVVATRSAHKLAELRTLDDPPHPEQVEHDYQGGGGDNHETRAA